MSIEEKKEPFFPSLLSRLVFLICRKVIHSFTHHHLIDGSGYINAVETFTAFISKKKKKKKLDE